MYCLHRALPSADNKKKIWSRHERPVFKLPLPRINNCSFDMGFCSGLFILLPEFHRWKVLCSSFDATLLTLIIYRLRKTTKNMLAATGYHLRKLETGYIPGGCVDHKRSVWILYEAVSAHH